MDVCTCAIPTTIACGKLTVRVVTTVAGIGAKKGYAGDGGMATEALNEPYEVRFDLTGDMYFVEMMNHVIRKVDMKTGKDLHSRRHGKEGFRRGWRTSK